MAIRNQYIDYIKGITIILVIIPHCIQYGSGADYLNNCLFYDNPIFKFIYTFHMPVFMIISGYLFKYTINRHSFNDIVKSRVTTLLIPIILWHSIYIFIDNYIIGQGNFSDIYWGSYLKFLWFLWAVLWNSFIVLSIHRFANDSFIVYASVFLLLLCVPHRYNSNYYVFMYPYFLCGYLINNQTNSIIKRLISKLSTPLYTIIISVTFFALLAIYSREDYVYVSKTDVIIGRHISSHMLLVNLYRWAIGFVGSFLFFRITHSIYHRFTGHITNIFFVDLGTRTMGIYIISDYTFRFFYLLPIKFPNYFFITIEIICVLGLSFFITWIIERNNYARKYLLGGR